MKASRFFLDTAYVLALLNPNDISITKKPKNCSPNAFRT
ncbi:hypothetical protein ANME2D_00568 [Candidatus Methanoperedens nitroreducens]|uniref:Uncharacterized protein n=1 Tax=Candidatus Methanoperedens nitratireducens TaxID=1392998 RepID=A0A062VE90_9EURY|nr:hypothetical protein ANME2D_00568 [Candidatus Methanoperedens nitroreducens]